MFSWFINTKTLGYPTKLTSFSVAHSIILFLCHGQNEFIKNLGAGHPPRNLQKPNMLSYDFAPTDTSTPETRSQNGDMTNPFHVTSKQPRHVETSGTNMNFPHVLFTLKSVKDSVQWFCHVHNIRIKENQWLMISIRENLWHVMLPFPRII